MQDANTIPVLLLTGYLGSGKTTLLNRILANTAGIRFAVIVNDIGEVNIDADLIQRGGVVSQQDDNLLSLTNGCICCTLKMDLVQQLHDLAAARAYDYIVIEASGICEPAPIAQTICSYARLVPFTEDPQPKLDCVVSVCDALRLRDEFADQLNEQIVNGQIANGQTVNGQTVNGQTVNGQTVNDEDLTSLVIQQIEFCNLVLLNKASEVTKEELRRIITIIRAIQPHAEIIPCDYCDVPVEQLVNTHLFNFDEVAGSAAWLEGVEGDMENEEEGEAYEYGISTFVYYRRRPFNLGLFDDFVARRWPKSVIRCKGMCYFSDEYDMCYLFEQAGRQLGIKQCGEFYATMPKDELERMMQHDPILRRDWDPEYGDRMQKLVFIGQDMDQAAITQALDACLE